MKKKQPTTLEDKNPVGRPTLYRDEYAEQARKLCLLGATDKELADFFSVAIDTINEWKNVHSEFSASIKEGKDLADATVADRLFKRATGYQHHAVKIFNDQGAPMVVGYTEHYPPDTTAAIFWLKNRQRDKWRDKQDVEQTVTATVQADVTHSASKEAMDALRAMVDKSKAGK